MASLFTPLNNVCPTNTTTNNSNNPTTMAVVMAHNQISESLSHDANPKPKNKALIISTPNGSPNVSEPTNGEQLKVKPKKQPKTPKTPALVIETDADESIASSCSVSSSMSSSSSVSSNSSSSSSKSAKKVGADASAAPKKPKTPSLNKSVTSMPPGPNGKVSTTPGSLGSEQKLSKKQSKSNMSTPTSNNIAPMANTPSQSTLPANNTSTSKVNRQISLKVR